MSPKRSSTQAELDSQPPIPDAQPQNQDSQPSISSKRYRFETVSATLDTMYEDENEDAAPSQFAEINTQTTIVFPPPSTSEVDSDEEDGETSGNEHSHDSGLGESMEGGSTAPQLVASVSPDQMDTAAEDERSSSASAPDQPSVINESGSFSNPEDLALSSSCSTCRSTGQGQDAAATITAVRAPAAISSSPPPALTASPHSPYKSTDGSGPRTPPMTIYHEEVEQRRRIMEENAGFSARRMAVVAARLLAIRDNVHKPIPPAQRSQLSAYAVVFEALNDIMYDSDHDGFLVRGLSIEAGRKFMSDAFRAAFLLADYSPGPSGTPPPTFDADDDGDDAPSSSYDHAMNAATNVIKRRDILLEELENRPPDPLSSSSPSSSELQARRSESESDSESVPELVPGTIPEPATAPATEPATEPVTEPETIPETETAPEIIQNTEQALQQAMDADEPPPDLEDDMETQPHYGETQMPAYQVAANERRLRRERRARRKAREENAGREGEDGDDGDESVGEGEQGEDEGGRKARTKKRRAGKK